MPDTLKPKQTRTPKQYEAIEKGALALNFEDRVKLKKTLTISIQNEFKVMEANFQGATKLVNGLDKE